MLLKSKRNIRHYIKPFVFDSKTISLQELEIPEVDHVLVTIGNQNTTTPFDWITRIEWRHQSTIQVHLHFSCWCGGGHCHLYVEPFGPLGGTGRAGCWRSSVISGYAFVNVSRLKATGGRVRPERNWNTEINRIIQSKCDKKEGCRWTRNIYVESHNSLGVPPILISCNV